MLAWKYLHYSRRWAALGKPRPYALRIFALSTLAPSLPSPRLDHRHSVDRVLRREIRRVRTGLGPAPRTEAGSSRSASMILAGVFAAQKPMLLAGDNDAIPVKPKERRSRASNCTLDPPWPGSRDRLGTAHRNYGLAVRTEASFQSVKSVILTGIRADAPIEGFSPKSRVSRKPGTRRPASVVRVSFDRRRSSPGSR